LKFFENFRTIYFYAANLKRRGLGKLHFWLVSVTDITIGAFFHIPSAVFLFLDTNVGIIRIEPLGNIRLLLVYSKCLCPWSRFLCENLWNNPNIKRIGPCIFLAPVRGILDPCNRLPHYKSESHTVRLEGFRKILLFCVISSIFGFLMEYTTKSVGQNKFYFA